MRFMPAKAWCGLTTPPIPNKNAAPNSPLNPIQQHIYDVLKNTPMNQTCFLVHRIQKKVPLSSNKNSFTIATFHLDRSRGIALWQLGISLLPEPILFEANTIGGVNSSKPKHIKRMNIGAAKLTALYPSSEKSKRKRIGNRFWKFFLKKKWCDENFNRLHSYYDAVFTSNFAGDSFIFRNYILTNTLFIWFVPSSKSTSQFWEYFSIETPARCDSDCNRTSISIIDKTGPHIHEKTRHSEYPLL